MTTVNDQTTGREPATRGGSLIRDAKTRRRDAIDLAIVDAIDRDDAIDRIDAAQKAYDAEIAQITACYPPSEPTDEQVDFHALARQIRADNATAISDAMTGLPMTSYVDLLHQLANFDPATVASFCDLIRAARAYGDGQPRYTAPLTLCVDQVDVPADGPRWQVLDGRDEYNVHDLTAVVECEDPACPVTAGQPGRECAVLVSTAWADGFAHFDVDDVIDVRIPAGEL